MLRHIVAAIAIQILVSAVPQLALADAPPDPANVCAPALTRDIFENDATTDKQLAFLEEIDESKFKSLKADASARTEIPLADSIIGASGDFHEFALERTALFQKLGYSANVQSAQRVLSITTSPESYDTFTKCMEIEAKKQIGLYAWIAAENANSLVVNYTYVSPPGGKKIFLQVTARGAILPDKRPSVALPNGSGSIVLSRTASSGTPVLIMVQGGGYPPSVLNSTYDVQKVVDYGSGVVIGAMPVTTTVDGGEFQSQSLWRSSNVSNESCDHSSACSTDGRWKASVVAMSMSPPPGSFFDSPVADTNDDAGKVFHVVDRIAVEPNGDVTATVRVWTIATTWFLKAHRMITVQKQIPETLYTTDFHSCGVASFLIPPAAISPIINVRYLGSTIAVKPGEDAAGGELKYLNAVSGATGTYFMYKAMPPEDKKCS